MRRLIDPEETRRDCPRCGAATQMRFRRDQATGRWEWVWTCPDCRREERVPEGIVERLEYM